MANVSMNDLARQDFARIAADTGAITQGTVIHTPNGGDAENVNAVSIRKREGVGEFNRQDGRVYRQEIELDFISDALTDLGPGSKFRVDSVDYKLDHIPHTHGPVITVVAIKIEQRDKGRRDRLLPTGG